MGIEVHMDPVMIEAGDLVAVFMRFCEAYKMEPRVDHVDTMISSGLRDFHSFGGINYSFAGHFVAQPIGGQYVFFAGSADDAKLQTREHKKFLRLLDEYFSQKGVKVKENH